MLERREFYVKKASDFEVLCPNCCHRNRQLNGSSSRVKYPKRSLRGLTGQLCTQCECHPLAADLDQRNDRVIAALSLAAADTSTYSCDYHFDCMSE